MNQGWVIGKYPTTLMRMEYLLTGERSGVVIVFIQFLNDTRNEKPDWSICDENMNQSGGE